MSFYRFVVAGGLLLAPPWVAAEMGLPGPATIAPAAEGNNPECWKPHAQVQPSPPRGSLTDEQNFGERFRIMAEEHVGAEHPTAARMRPCGSLPPPAGGSDKEAAKR